MLKNNFSETPIKFGIALSFSFFYPLYANATDVSSWADINTAKNNDIAFTGDIQATGTPKNISLSKANQEIDGAGYSLTGAAGFKLTVDGDNSVIKNFGTVTNGNENDSDFSYTDINGDTFYKKITASVTGFSNTTPFVTSKNFSLQDSVFSNNTTKVLFNIGAGASFSNIVFYNNGNKNSGAWDSVIRLNGGTLELDNVIFDSNKAEGAIIEVNSNLTINNSIFQNNDTTYMSVIDIESGEVEINNSQFINNANYEGGAIVQTQGFKSASNTIFKGNRSRYSGGGAIYLPIQSGDTIKHHYFSATTFEDNQAADLGGGIYISGAGTPTHHGYFLDSSFKGNTAELGGGILTSDLLDLWVVDTDFEDNEAVVGGGIYAADMTLNIYAKNKDVTFSGNVATDQDDDFNGGEAVFMEADSSYAEMAVNAAAEKKVVFDNTVAGYGDGVVLNINKGGLTYIDFDDEEIEVAADGEIQFNARVGDGENYFSAINLWGGKLSIGQNDELNDGIDNPDGYLNDNNFYITGDSTLNTVNGVIGEFAPRAFEIDAALDYEFDVNLASSASDKINGATVNDGGSVNLSVLNVLTDTDKSSVKVTYSDTNIGGILKDDYTITTSTATYEVTAENDDSGSHLVFAKASELGGLAKAIKDASSVYSNTSDTDEIVEAWDGNSLQADLIINGNGHAITTENSLDGINIGSEYALTINDVTDMSGFNYALSNEGTVELNNTTISDEIINNGVLEVNDNVSLGSISGSGTTNINADLELTAAIHGNTVNVEGAQLSGANHLGLDVNLNVNSGTIDLGNQATTVKSANFDAESTLNLSINTLSEYGILTAESITVANGAKLQATLAQGLVSKDRPASLQLLSANNTDFNNFTDSFDNNMYHFEKEDKNGLYKITLVSSAEDIVDEEGARPWIAEAAKDYIDEGHFKKGTVAADIADKLAQLAQTDAPALVEAIKTLAPMENTVIQGQAIADVNRLFKTVDGYLRGTRDLYGLSSGDELSGVAIWAKPYIGQSKLDRRGKIASLKTNNRGVITGIEKKIYPELKLGVGLQYDETDMDTLHRDIDASTTVGFVYGEYKKNRWFVNATGSYGISDYDEYMYTLGSKYAANYSVKTTSVAAATGYQIGNFTPEVGLHYYNIKRNGYTDGAMQEVRKAGTRIVRANGGVHFIKNYESFCPDIYLGLIYDLVPGKNNTVVNLTNNTSYTVKGKRLPRLGYEVNAGLSTHLTDNITVGANYNGIYREKYQEHTGMLKLQYAF